MSETNTLYEIVLQSDGRGTKFTVSALPFTKKTESNYILVRNSYNNRYLSRIPVDQVNRDFIKNSDHSFNYLTLIAYTELESEIKDIKYRLQRESLNTYTNRVNLLKEILEALEKVEV